MKVMMRKTIPMALLLLIAGLASAQQVEQTGPASEHIEMYLSQMRADMDAIEKEPDPDTKQKLMESHNESMSRALALMQTELMSITLPHTEAEIENMDQVLILQQQQELLEQMIRVKEAIQFSESFMF